MIDPLPHLEAIARALGEKAADGVQLCFISDPRKFIEILRNGIPSQHINYALPEALALVLRELELGNAFGQQLSFAYSDAMRLAEEAEFLRQADALEAPADWYDVQKKRAVREATLDEKWDSLGQPPVIRLPTGELVRLRYRHE